MTGTASTSRGELKKIYKVHVESIPTNKPPIRRQLPTLVFGTSDQKWDAVVEDTYGQHQLGRPVLIGTRSIDKSEHLAGLLAARGLTPVVLNARHIAQEAEIVAAAGSLGKITVATNMAGRGTDIKLGEGVHALGGLHVICTELHEAKRIDRQLIGRCGRQGDPGSYRFLLALDDDILAEGLGKPKAEELKRRGASSTPRFDDLAPLFTKAQSAVEANHYRGRRLLMHHEKERKEMQVRMGMDPYLDTVS
jgi:preprotein translocase subunit SecA